MQYTGDDYSKAIKILFNRNPSSAPNTMCKCPYHEDKTPSLSVHNDTGQYRCFSCKRQGHLSTLCYDVTVPKKVVTIEEVETSISMDIRGTMVPWHLSSKAVMYLRERGIPGDIADKHLMTFMEAGFINGYPYEDRLCVPIYSPTTQKLIAVEGRDVTFKAKRKCVYPYKSVKPIYNLHKVDLTKPVFMFEGLLKQLVAETDPFFKNAVSSFGSQLSAYQILYLNTIPHLIACIDNDRAGEEQAEQLKKTYKGKLEIWRLNSSVIKDVDEIPTKLHISVEEFRKHDGFIPELR